MLRWRLERRRYYPPMRFAALFLLVACSSDKKDWSDTPLEPHTVTVKDITDANTTVTFTISVPKGLPTDKDEKPGTWNVTKFEGDYVPKIFTSLSSMPDATLDDFIRGAILNKDKMNLVRKETRPDGFAITDAPTTKRRIEVRTAKKLGADNQLECTAVQVGDGEVPSPDKTRAMLEKICDSIAVK